MKDVRYNGDGGTGMLKSNLNDCCAPSVTDTRVQLPLVEHLATINVRLESIEGQLEIVQNWIVGPSPEYQADGTSGDPNLESQIFRSERIASRIEYLVNEIRGRLS